MNSNRRQSFVPTAGLEVIYEGSKTFWKTRTTVDILIVSHPKQNCFELIAYNAEKGNEAPRVYVNAILLSTKLDQNEIKLKVEEKKESSIRQKKATNVAQIQKEIATQAIIQFITSRFQISEDPAQGLRIFLSAMSGDIVNEQTKELDFVMSMPQSLTPIPTCFQKKVSVNEIKHALGQLEIENAELKRATRLAELATSSVDGFKLMLAEKMRLEIEMKKKFSPARLRWIKAINRVLIQNYVQKVRARLGWDDAPAVPAKPSPERARPKMFRRSIDNSMLEKTTLPAIVKHAPATVTSPHLNTTASLPVLSPRNEEHGSMEKRRRRIGRDGSSQKLQRRSYESLPSGESKSERMNLACNSDDSVPSLLQSYTSVSQRLVPSISVPLFSDVQEHNTRALRLIKL